MKYMELAAGFESFLPNTTQLPLVRQDNFDFSFNERTTGRESLELMKRFLFLIIILRQKTLHFEEPRDAVILAWATRDPAFRRERPQISPIWILNAIRSPVLTARLRA